MLKVYNISANTIAVISRINDFRGICGTYIALTLGSTSNVKT
jgi:hypothetical protein